MGDFSATSGKLRTGNVSLYKGTTVSHVAPPAKQVSRLMDDLLQWLARTDYHPLITSSVFHYELEFIHPFPDGNGRMDRFWQTLILGQWNELFYLLPIESLIKDEQDATTKRSNKQTRRQIAPHSFALCWISLIQPCAKT